MAEKSNCGNCGAMRHIVTPQNIKGQDECHALPPQMIVLMVANQQGLHSAPGAAWPPVSPDQWCAAWRPKATALM